MEGNQRHPTLDDSFFRSPYQSFNALISQLVSWPANLAINSAEHCQAATFRTQILDELLDRQFLHAFAIVADEKESAVRSRELAVATVLEIVSFLSHNGPFDRVWKSHRLAVDSECLKISISKEEQSSMTAFFFCLFSLLSYTCFRSLRK